MDLFNIPILHRHVITAGVEVDDLSVYDISVDDLSVDDLSVDDLSALDLTGDPYMYACMHVCMYACMPSTAPDSGEQQQQRWRRQKTRGTGFGAPGPARVHGAQGHHSQGAGGVGHG